MLYNTGTCHIHALIVRTGNTTRFISEITDRMEVQ